MATPLGQMMFPYISAVPKKKKTWPFRTSAMTGASQKCIVNGGGFSQQANNAGHFHESNDLSKS